MIIFNDLEKLGYTKETIDKFIAENKVILTTNGDYKIIDFGMLISIINYYYPNYDFLKDNANIDDKTYDILTELFRLIYLKQYLLAFEVVYRLFKERDIHEISILFSGLNANISDIHYTHEEEYKGKKYVKYIERKLLVDFIFNDKEDIGKRMKDLSFYYSALSPLPFTLMNNYLKSYEKLIKNKNLINNRDFRKYTAEPMAVLNNLLNQGDYISAHKVLNDCYISNCSNEFIINYEIYRIIDKWIMRELAKNTKRVNKEIEIKSNGYNSINEIVSKYNLSSISCAQMERMDIQKDLHLDSKVDYLSEYKKNVDKHEYREALLDIIKHEKVMHQMALPCNLYYLMKELNILITNQENDSIEMQEEHYKLLEQASIKQINKFYDEAIDLYNKSFDYEGIKTPAVYARIAECYMAKEDYKKAVECYNLEYQEYMYPMDFLHYIESLYYINDLDTIFRIADEFELYYPSSSSLVHYILSICYAKIGDYDEALQEIGFCEDIGLDSYDLTLCYVHEKKVLNNLSEGKEMELYTLDDYKDHCFSQYEIDRIKSYDIDSLEDGELLIKVINENTNEILEDKIKFLFTLYRVLVYMERPYDSRDILNYIHQLQQHVELTEEDNNYFTSIMRKL